ICLGHVARARGEGEPAAGLGHRERRRGELAVRRERRRSRAFARREAGRVGDHEVPAAVLRRGARQELERVERDALVRLGGQAGGTRVAPPSEAWGENPPVYENRLRTAAPAAWRRIMRRLSRWSRKNPVF